MFEKRLIQKIGEAAGDLSLITPGLRLMVAHHGRIKADIAMGETFRYYDLASLTKVLFTVPVAMRLYENKLLRLDREVQRDLHWFQVKGVTPKGLLTHSAGLPWWYPFYKKIGKPKDISEQREKVKPILAAMKKERRRKAVYSDIDFIMLGYLFESLLESPLNAIWNDLPVRDKCRSFHFNPLNEPTYTKGLYAPTERCPWRKKILQGEVHDDNTWAFGGLSTHAGLFGTAEDVMIYAQELRRGLRDINTRTLGKSETIRKFTRRALTKDKGDWALGFMLPTPGAASCGKYFSPSSFGHTGFTGTSLWVDPVKDLIVVCLSNRVHPTRKNTRFVKFRPLIHDIVAGELGY